MAAMSQVGAHQSSLLEDDVHGCCTFAYQCGSATLMMRAGKAPKSEQICDAGVGTPQNLALLRQQHQRPDFYHTSALPSHPAIMLHVTVIPWQALHPQCLPFTCCRSALVDPRLTLRPWQMQ